LTEQKELVRHLKNLRKPLEIRKEKLSRYRFELETRIKQKDYKWSDKDVLVVKEAVKELEKFCHNYITNWVQVLEPIINNIINNIGFSIKFSLNDQGNLDLLLAKNNQEYGYKDLSTGQKLILTVAFQIALLMERGEEGLIVADEGFSSLDEKNLNLIFDLFKNLPFQLICVIHRLPNVPEGANVIKL